jgi:2-polyprenyl-3-methyl-5-hydroxy-6-metoxy-1,4-benzoquinol methylase
MGISGNIVQTVLRFAADRRLWPRQAEMAYDGERAAEIVAAEPEREFVLPVELARNQRQIDGDGLKSIEQSIKKNYHTGWRSESNYSKAGYEADLQAHVYKRLEGDRSTIIPWIANSEPLNAKRILEVGCGTGSSTVALAEQGARVTAIDIDKGALSVAQDRSKIYAVKVEFCLLSANCILDRFGADAFDIVIYFACLEHMTISERLASLRQGWEALCGGGLFIIIETPNRLWHYDSHTSMLPFFHWLPDELAFQYTKFSSRENFCEIYRDYDDENSRLHFLRRGSGMSFHELDLAIMPARELNVISSLSGLHWMQSHSNELGRRYKSLLMSLYPGLHEGFFDEYLYLIIAKNQ